MIPIQASFLESPSTLFTIQETETIEPVSNIFPENSTYSHAIVFTLTAWPSAHRPRSVIRALPLSAVNRLGMQGAAVGIPSCNVRPGPSTWHETRPRQALVINPATFTTPGVGWTSDAQSTNSGAVLGGLRYRSSTLPALCERLNTINVARVDGDFTI